MRLPHFEFHNVSHALDGKTILEDISWVVRPGEHWAILGPNGAGKTTLLKLICGYIWPNSGGEVFRKGERLIDLSELRRSIGWVSSDLITSIPQNQIVLSTVISGKYAQIRLAGYPWEAPTPADVERATAFLEELGCADLGERNFRDLSQGEQQKVLICRARMTGPYLIILDEPCAGMDPGSRERFLKSLSPFEDRRSSPSLIFVTHHVEEILPFFKKALLLKDGKILARGHTTEIITAGSLKVLYDVDIELVRRNGRYWPIPESPEEKKGTDLSLQLQWRDPPGTLRTAWNAGFIRIGGAT
jgi:iron complex transport system ATP-binding protein